MAAAAAAAAEAGSLWVQLGSPAGRDLLWRRHRRTVLVCAGVAGAGAVGYWAWCRWSEAAQQEQALREQREADLARLRMQRDRARQIEEAARADAQLQTHFESIQVIADSTTLPSVLPHLKTRLFSLIDLSALTDALVASRTGQGEQGLLSSHEKMRIWEDLKVLSFTRALGSMWAVGLLFLFVRIQLNILGRHVYFHTAAEDNTESSDKQATEQPQAADSQGALDEQQRQLSMSCQHKFIAFSDYLPHCGLAALLQDVQEAMASALHLRSLKDKFNPEQLRTLVLDLRAEFEASHATRWHRYLLPPGNVLPEDLAVASSAADVAQAATATASGGGERPHGGSGEEDDHAVSLRGGALASAMAGAYQRQRASHEALSEAEAGGAQLAAGAGAGGGAAGSKQGRGGDGSAEAVPAEDAALEGLMAETRSVLSSAQFREALKSAMDCISQTALSELAVSAFPQASQRGAPSPAPPAPAAPLAKLLPPVASVAASLLEVDENRHLASLSSVPDLTAFSARVYAGTVGGTAPPG